MSGQGVHTQGQCLCGALKFKVALKDDHVHACHCTMCRQWSASPFMGISVVGGLQFEDDAALGRYSASEWGERLFCKNCGSSLAWQTKDQKLVSVSAGAIDIDSAQLTEQYFIDSKPEFYAFAGNSKTLTGEEIFAAFAAGQGE